jgi:hypothetical protein
MSLDLFQEMRQTRSARAAEEALVDPVVLAQTKLDAARKKFAERQAEVTDATSLLQHSEKQLEEEDTRLWVEKLEAREAVLAKKPIPTCAPSALDAINDAIGTLKSRLQTAKADLKVRQNDVASCEGALREATQKDGASKFAAALRAFLHANPQLLAQAKALAAGEFEAQGLKVVRGPYGGTAEGACRSDGVAIKIDFTAFEAS